MSWRPAARRWPQRKPSVDGVYLLRCADGSLYVTAPGNSDGCFYLDGLALTVDNRE